MTWAEDLDATRLGPEEAGTAECRPDAEGRARELAKLKPLAYEQVREREAGELGIRVSALDAAVEAERKRGRGDAASDDEADGPAEPVESIERWHAPVSGLEVAEGVRAELLRHVIFPSEADADAITLWCLGTFLMDVWRLFPKLLIRSPTKRCGKSTALEVVEAHTYRPLLTSNITAPSLFRCIETWRPTLLIDEADRFLKENQEANGILNAGHTRRTARVIRTTEVNGNHEPRAFSVWGPQAIASIGAQMDTLQDRAIRSDLRRKLPSEHIDQIPVDYFERQEEARRKLMRWATDNAARIGGLDLVPPDCGNDRARNNWTPLYRIAAILSGPWPERMSAAYSLKESSADADDEPAKIMALRDAMTVVEDRGVDRIESAVLTAALVEMEDRPWPEWRHGKAITATGLSKLLRDFGVKPMQLRFGSRSQKGYLRAPIADAFERYCQTPPAQTETPKQASEINDLDEDRTETSGDDVSVTTGPKSLKPNGCFGVSVGGRGYEEDVL